MATVRNYHVVPRNLWLRIAPIKGGIHTISLYCGKDQFSTDPKFFTVRRCIPDTRTMDMSDHGRVVMTNGVWVISDGGSYYITSLCNGSEPEKRVLDQNDVTFLDQTDRDGDQILFNGENFRVRWPNTVIPMATDIRNEPLWYNVLHRKLGLQISTGT